MRKSSLLLMLIVVFTATAFPAQAENDPVIARVGDIEIRQSAIDHKLEEIPVYARTNFETLEGQKKLLDRIVRTQVLKKAAIDTGYLNKHEIIHQIEEATDRILSSAYFQDNMSIGPVPDEKKMKRYYEDNKEDKFQIEASADVQQIVLASREDAQLIRQQLLAETMTFDEAVKQHSIDESKTKGGLVEGIRESGFIRGVGRSKDLINVVFALKADEISEPVETRRGFHLIKLVQRTNAGYQDFDTVKPTIAKALMVKDKEIKADYIANEADYKTRARCKISHILVNTEEEAEKIHEQLRNGDSFTELVQSQSIDAQSRKQDGNLGYLYKGGYVRGVGKDVEFENAVFALEEGSTSRPIKSRKGWHIVKVMEKQPEVVKPLIEVEEQIRQKLITEKKEEHLENKFKDLEKKYNVQIFEENFNIK